MNLRALSVPCLTALCVVLASCKPTVEEARDARSVAVTETGRESVKVNDGIKKPLIVDWLPEQRGDLEEAVRDGVVVVTFDKSGLRMLHTCRLAGEYSFVAFDTSKEEVIHLESMVDVAANFPVGGPLLGKVGGAFERDGALDIALAMIGKRRTAWADVTRDDLKGKCDDATHYVRAITLGAFAIRTGTRNQVKAAAEVFGVGAHTGVKNERAMDSTDGKLDSCSAVTTDSPRPPQGCAAMLRIELAPISASPALDAQGAVAAKKPQASAPDTVSCPPGFVWSGDACKQAQANAPHTCDGRDAKDCDTQCTAGDALSCAVLAALVLQTGGADADTRANALLARSCKGHSVTGCALYAERTMMAAGPSDMDPKDAVPILRQACGAGESFACFDAGLAYNMGKGGVQVDMPEAVRLYTRGCELGHGGACTNVGTLFLGANGVPRDDARSFKMAERACQAGEGVACGNVGFELEFGIGATANMERAVAFYQRSCRMAPSECGRLGLLLSEGIGVAKDEAMAHKAYGMSCQGKESDLASLSCYLDAKLYGGKGTPDRAALGSFAQVMKPQCEHGHIARACSFYGAAMHALGQHEAGDQALGIGCELKDPWACAVRKRLQ